MKFIKIQDVPRNRMEDVTYGHFLCMVQPDKAEKNRTRFTARGDGINYPGEMATSTVEMLVAKILFNSVVSIPGARFVTMDISNLYLMTPLTRPEFIRIDLQYIPEEMTNEYKLKDIATTNRFIYIRADKGMYGLHQVSLLTNVLIKIKLLSM